MIICRIHNTEGRNGRLVFAGDERVHDNEMRKGAKSLRCRGKLEEWAVGGGPLSNSAPTTPAAPLLFDTEKYYAAAGLPLNPSDSLPNFKLPSC